MADGDQEKVDFKVWIDVWGTMLGAFMAVLDIQITNASLRNITGGIAATEDEGSWIPTQLSHRRNHHDTAYCLVLPSL